MSAQLLRTDLDESRNWAFLGEGNANLVFAYQGSQPHLVGKVLRLSKSSTLVEHNQLLADLEGKVWASCPGLDQPGIGLALLDQYCACCTRTPACLSNRNSDTLPEATAAADSALRQLAFGSVVLTELLGSRFTDKEKPVTLSQEFASELLANNSTNLRGAAPTTLTAGLLPDHTVFGPETSASCSTPVLCIEIKPKCGFLPVSDSIHPANSLKKQVPRFWLHQTLKVVQGKYSRVSRYNPVDLFSGSAPRMEAALQALLRDPQNNLRLFRDGRPVSLVSADSEAVEAALFDAMPFSTAQLRESLVRLLRMVMQFEGVLQRILTAQQLDMHDIEGVVRVYRRLLASLSSNAAASGSPMENSMDASAPPTCIGSVPTDGELSVTSDNMSRHQHAIEQLTQLSHEQAYELLRSYLTAVTAKDCSLMITLQHVMHDIGAAPQHASQQSMQDSSPGMVRDPVGGCWFRYKIAVVDLDLKPISKIEQHYQLDQEIVACARHNFHLLSDLVTTQQ